MDFPQLYQFKESSRTIISSHLTLKLQGEIDQRQQFCMVMCFSHHSLTFSGCIYTFISESNYGEFLDAVTW